MALGLSTHVCLVLIVCIPLRTRARSTSYQRGETYHNESVLTLWENRSILVQGLCKFKQ